MSQLTPVDTQALLDVFQALGRGDFSPRLSPEACPDCPELAGALNGLLDQLQATAEEINRITREVGDEGRFGGQAEVPGLEGSWAELVQGLNRMAANLTMQVRCASHLGASLAMGDLRPQPTPPAAGETAALFGILNTLAETLGDYTARVEPLARGAGIPGPESWSLPGRAIWSIAGEASVAWALIRLAEAARERGDFERARGLSQRVLHIGLELEALGNPFWVAPSLAGFATLAAAQGQMDRAGRLWGAAEAASERLGRPFMPAALAERLGTLASDPVFFAARQEGATMTRDRAVAYALEP